MCSERTLIDNQVIPNYQDIYLEELAKRNKEAYIPHTETVRQKLFRYLRDSPEKLADTRESFQETVENLLWIKQKNRKIVPFRTNRSQSVLFDAFYEMKMDGDPTRIIILKGRQQGMSTGIGAIAIAEMLSKPETSALISSEEKQGSARNIFDMYHRFFEHFASIIKEEVQDED